MAYFFKIFTFLFFFNVLFTFQQPMEMKANLPWREAPGVFGVFTAPRCGAAGRPAERGLAPEVPRKTELDRWARPPQSVRGLTDRKSHAVSFSAAERDRSNQTSITVPYQRPIVI